MSMGKVIYSIVTTVRNEGRTIRTTLEAVSQQIITPAKWVIIDDGSTDETRDILAEYQSQFQWIEVITLKDKGYYDYESAHKNIQVGLNKILEKENDYIVKLDGDLDFEMDYFLNVFKKFEENQKLGIAAGWFFIYKDNMLCPEVHPANHVRGGSKIYRRKCWEDIGGIVPKIGYDTIDEIKANMKGWETYSFSDIKVIHLKPTYSQRGLIGGIIYQGKTNYLVWYHPIFMILKAVKYSFTKKPLLISGLALLYGFLKCYYERTPRSIYEDDFIKYLRRKQFKKLIPLNI